MRCSCGRVFCVIAVMILFGGMFMHVSMLARISEKSKQASALEREIARLGTEADNLELSINQYHNLERINILALELGMEPIRDGQIRAIDVSAAGLPGRDGT